ncbi:type II CAAX endopeptidase family protein [Aliiroseovarius sp. KMU-50]|uniref:Type II CAAX endopeptidase family protein n=1 Tax=Aliiroseovarius salicola TaxID=3009082 RepID=A0ABT4VYM5_9RHOB|nr:type II CAAX endopeptidase family protein [Aliiroseovarius sp. KMU-50]MDA5092643.1 type II CAAX endopeptidase family protein [Aliiroseovarius sp. KMU-50]
MNEQIPNSFWQPAMERRELWRSLLGIILIHVAFFAATFVLFIAGGLALGITPQSILGASTPAQTMVFFATFLGYHIGLWLVVRFLHKRNYRSLFGPSGQIMWRHFSYGFGAAVCLVFLGLFIEGVGLIPSGEHPQPELQQNMPISLWLTLLVPSLALIFMQIMAEELVFRGYLLQQLRARFSSIWLWAVLPSFLFGILHFDISTYGVNAYFYVLHTTIAGIILALITLRTGNIGAAAGLHMANNAGLVVIGNQGILDGLSLFLSNPVLTSTYVSASILTQTSLMVLAFLFWWFWLYPPSNTDKQLQMPSGKIT